MSWTALRLGVTCKNSIINQVANVGHSLRAFRLPLLLMFNDALLLYSVIKDNWTVIDVEST